MSAIESSPFRECPLELLLRISYWLKTPELGNFRLTCRSIHNMLDAAFIREFFTRKQFMLHDFSLRALTEISKSRLAPHLQFVNIGLDFIPDDSPLAHQGPRGEAYRRMVADTMILWNSGALQDMLAEAFRNLPNLEGVVLRSFNSSRRSRDGWGYEWRSYGVNTITDRTGQRPALNRYGGKTRKELADRAFVAVLSGLAKSGSRPKGLEMMSRNDISLSDFAFGIPWFLRENLLPVLQGLEKLHLTIDLDWRPSAHASYGTSQQAPSYSMLLDFLKETANLKELRLNQVPGAMDSSPSNLNDCLSALSQANHQALSCLETFSLGRALVSYQTLLNFVRIFAPQLKSLSLWRIALLQDLPEGHLRLDGLPKTEFWPSFLKEMREISNLSLKHIMIGHAGQMWAKAAGFNEYQVSPASFPSGPVMEYEGPDWRHFVLDNENITVSWSKAYGPQESYSSTPEEEEDDVEEDSESEGDDA